MTCKKHRFNSKREAKARLREIRHSKTHSCKHYYLCPLCAGWHLTSMSREEYRQKQAQAEAKEQRLYREAIQASIDLLKIDVSL